MTPRPGIVCVCVNVARNREAVVAVFPEAVHGSGPEGAWTLAVEEAKRRGPPDRVTVDYWPPTHPGLTYEVPAEIMREVDRATKGGP